ncbi:hypothetical protein BDN70DRAFT_874219 [Pholiota conissans]|uniref:Uncharacterized protein n=1 Tax=Pholiota conissans TaxID=109636 RepID=A0A9P5Z7S5_9AGAR|nr:hypothetical protein BDN70DRAFT_874219 [Pholiota conissans]
MCAGRELCRAISGGVSARAKWIGDSGGISSFSRSREATGDAKATIPSQNSRQPDIIVERPPGGVHVPNDTHLGELPTQHNTWIERHDVLVNLSSELWAGLNHPPGPYPAMPQRSSQADLARQIMARYSSTRMSFSDPYSAPELLKKLGYRDGQREPNAHFVDSG